MPGTLSVSANTALPNLDSHVGDACGRISWLRRLRHLHHVLTGVGAETVEVQVERIINQLGLRTNAQCVQYSEQPPTTGFIYPDQ